MYCHANQINIGLFLSSHRAPGLLAGECTFLMENDGDCLPALYGAMLRLWFYWL